jgi:hypothetical protein
MKEQGQKLVAAGAASIIAVPALAHFGGTGIIVGLAAGAAAYLATDEIHNHKAKQAAGGGDTPLVAEAQPHEKKPAAPGRHSLAYRLLNGKSARSDEAENEKSDEDDELDDIFSLEHQAADLPCARLTMEQIIAQLQRKYYNQYVLYLGRSVLLDGNPARSVNILKQHLKLIGASQKGKSSMAGCLLTQALAAHDIDHLLVSILDLEDKTGKLFTGDPHIAQFQMGEINVPMHAHNEEQVLEYLGYIVQLMRWRYTQPTEVIAEMPVLLVYVEEFLDLKKFFKTRMITAKSEAKAQAEQDYTRLIEYISVIARRGLKARIQLLLCAQVDYRDEDLYEALANITAGMCFAVKPSAAKAAGFEDAEMVARVRKDNIAGQAAAEFAGCKDVILAPDFPLEQLLIAWEREHAKRRRHVAQLGEFRLQNDADQQGMEDEDEESESQQEQGEGQKQSKRERIIQKGAQLRFEGLSQAACAEKLNLTAWTIRPYWAAIEAEVERLRELESQAE